MLNTVLSASVTGDNKLLYLTRHTPFRVHEDGDRNALRNCTRPYEDMKIAILKDNQS